MTSLLQDDHVRNLFFGDFIFPDANPRVYDEIQDLSQLTQVMDHYLDEFNQVRNFKHLVTVFNWKQAHILHGRGECVQLYIRRFQIKSSLYSRYCA